MLKSIMKFLKSKYLLWIVLANPGMFAIFQFFKGSAEYGMLMHLTGEFAGRFLVISLIATPIAMLFPKGRISKWLVRNRRFFGLSAFAYTLLHTIFYLLEESFSKILEEFFQVGMITGWIAFFIFIPLAFTSTDAAVKRMGVNWKRLQRWVYLAAVMTFFHWALVKPDHPHWGPALFHFTPVILLSLYRLWFLFIKSTSTKSFNKST